MTMKTTIKNEVLKFELGKNQSQKNRSQKSVIVKPPPGNNTQESNIS